MYHVELLPAAHGDAIWIEYGPLSHPHRILIDGGPASSYLRGLRTRIEHARQAGPLHIDLFVVTHIDCDHIDGAIIFLQECKSLGVTVGEIWFNGWKHLATFRTEAYKPLQGEFLGALVSAKRDFRTKWNRSFQQQAVVIPDGANLPTKVLPGGAVATLLSPTQRQLNRLRAQWVQAIREFSAGDERAALDRLKLRRDYVPPRAVDIFSTETFGGDRSAPNGSSIAFLLEIEGKSCLFAADAHSRVLTASLQQLCRERQVDRLSVDAVKLPHHGSMGNVDDAMLALINTDRWLISTNGAVFRHPDRETVEMIAKFSKRRPTFACNYRVKTTEALIDDHRRWIVEFPAASKANVGPSGGLRVDLLSGADVDQDRRTPSKLGRRTKRLRKAKRS